MDHASTGLNFEERGIADAIAQRTLRVPLNQRPYAWTEEEVQTLVDDLYRAFDEGATIYFLGTIVLTRGNNKQWEVADGQQRLATTSILIAAVRDFLIELGDDAGAAKYQSTFLLDYDPRKKDFSPKFYLNYEDHDFFLSTILKPPKERKVFAGQHFNSHDRLAAAAKLASNHVRKMVAAFPLNEKASRLYDWIDFLREAAKIIIIMVPGKVGNAFKMFETLNARGMEASQLDILKNFLFDLAKDRLAEVHPRWIQMISTIEGLGEDGLLLKFVRHFWISQHGPTTERDLGSSVEAFVKSERQAAEIITALSSNASDYVAILKPRDHPRWNELSRTAKGSLYTISHELGGEQIRPLILAVARNFPAKEAEKAFEIMVSWSVRFLIAGGGGGGVLDKNYGSRAREITKGELTTAKQLKERMSEVVPNDEVFKRAFSSATVRKNNLARYYLKALELYVKDETRPQLLPNEDTSAVNLEHVLPVTPSEDWDIEPDIASAYYKRIGNMALLNSRQNVDLGNKSFVEKKPILKISPFILTSEIAKQRTWGPKQIEKRQAELAEFAVKVWPI
ncbi:DUF262 domain-containing HNH endonuclease family protein [Rhodoblastus acidophilus]|uniref:DUF262 domain-containing HNH endonuclease family protein n=1 Tax=Candidatus Rhodoblastus alkanivorans TaxID=2954117 RepID=A0ABS9Z508_9HYPH|nr:DUF262 domain-containing protein [Candidatus Rhodoblastus alkanivorans]MCI4680246.1 DUF262 domain-containing HNH endonuclease family protein [Candidatus Rhodoblastus alkanivorans]MCI4682765.1 DUF262 domain-containing HNH endonuclease family protein [Candidatus Rhodoblastus alkanivorans]MDI4640072.1 DUF262 domain-containing HNH endonuclease family protein [Rhodoblastus acidophilus]